MRTKRARCLSLLTVVGISLVAASSQAQNSPSTSTPAKSGDFSVQRFEPAPGMKNFLSVEGARMEGAMGFSVGVLFDYSRDPFVLVSCKDRTNCKDPNAAAKDVHVLQDMFTWNILAAISPIKILQIGLRVPLIYADGQGITADGKPATDPLKTFAVGDPSLEGKLRLYGGASDPFVIGLSGNVRGPIGHLTSKDNYIGNDYPLSGGIRAIFDGHAGIASFGLNVGGYFQKPGHLGTTQVGPAQLTYGAGVGLQFSPIFRLLAEGWGATQFQSKNGTNTLEADGAFEIKPISVPLSFRVGGGAGILKGVGVPTFRVIGGLTYAHEVGDQDGDGIPDDKDSCVTLAEDKDGFEDADGCPDDDNDGDRIPDGKDKCPNQAETVNGFQDSDGCPDEVSDKDKDGIPDEKDKCPEAGGKDIINRPGQYYGCPDTDKDGVPDYLDKCPTEAEDTDGFQDVDGCPDPDNDHDGIPDEQDECIDQPEVINGYKDEDGCPDEAPDKDHDGIPDHKDKCPDKPENYNGFEDEDGCPDKGPSLVQVSEAEIKILERIEFATNKDKIEGTKSFAVLNAVVGALKGHPEIFLVEVAGHTDNAGNAGDNRTLSQKRAEAVVAYLKDKGIDANRLQAKGYGPDKPIADNKTAAGRQKNRRVEFNILRSVKNPGTPAPAPAAPGAPPPAAPPAAPKK